ncbi:MAG: putative RNA uridine N3 methyltransferase [Methermicoccaceae archaeon]
MQVARRKLTILIPSSLLEEVGDLRVKTYKIGQLARTMSVFQADKMAIYRDGEVDESRLIDLVLRYAETPQYLRRHLFPRKRELKYAGVLQPLRTPHHPLRSAGVGEYRVGVLIKVEPDGSAWVELGLERPALLRNPEGVKEGERINVRVFSKTPLVVERVQRDEVPVYWGYQTKVVQSLDRELQELKEMGTYLIGTSRMGVDVTLSLLDSIRKDMGDKDVAIAFGSPRKGLNKMVQRMSVFDVVLNTIPNQGSETVRTEEALFATLALINTIR